MNSIAFREMLNSPETTQLATVDGAGGEASECTVQSPDHQ